MIQTTVRLERPEGTALLVGIPVQIEAASARERTDLEGARQRASGGRATALRRWLPAFQEPRQPQLVE